MVYVQQYASSMVMRLQLAIQEVNSALEETSQQVGDEFFFLSPFRLPDKGRPSGETV